MEALRTNKNDMKDAQKRMEAIFKELKYNRSSLNNLWSDIDSA